MKTVPTKTTVYGTRKTIKILEKPTVPDFFPKLRKIVDVQKPRPQTHIFGELSNKTPDVSTERNFTKISAFSIIKETCKSNTDQKSNKNTENIGQERSLNASSQTKRSDVPELLEASLELKKENIIKDSHSEKKKDIEEKKVDYVRNVEEEKVLVSETTKENRVDEKKMLMRTSSLGESQKPPLAEKHNILPCLATSPRDRPKNLSRPLSTYSSLTKNPIFQTNQFLISNVATIDTRQLESPPKIFKINVIYL
ncbi:hypothetical protein MXB_3685 [Myxobolus squamalis]|nr:hypothetical protein MXB_3685 [Myxobolus squamalis]